MSTVASRSSRALRSDRLLELGTEMALSIWEQGSAQSPAIRNRIAAFPNQTLRREVQQLARNIDAELDRIGEIEDQNAATAARRELAISVYTVQFGSKLWLIEELSKHCDLSSVSLVVLGGWYGILPLLANWVLDDPPPHMVTVDNDPEANAIGSRMVGSLHGNIEYRCEDVMYLDYSSLATPYAPVVINTICEHLPSVGSWWELVPDGQLVALQSNNLEDCADHVSCVHSVEQFKQQVPMSELLFEGVRNFTELDRYMLIGRK